MKSIKLNNTRVNESHESSLSNDQVQPSIVLNNGVEIPQIGYGAMMALADTERLVSEAQSTGYHCLWAAPSSHRAAFVVKVKKSLLKNHFTCSHDERMRNACIISRFFVLLYSNRAQEWR